MPLKLLIMKNDVIAAMIIFTYTIFKLFMEDHVYSIEQIRLSRLISLLSTNHKQ